MTKTSTAAVPTPNASRYLQQLCKHWQHNLKVEFTPEQGTIVFPRDARGADWPGDAVVTMTAQAEALECRIEASAPGQLEALKGAVARHLDRFAFREAPLGFDWRDAG
jgi:uncharacterized protein